MGLFRLWNGDKMKLICECGAEIWPKDIDELKIYSSLDCPKNGTHNFKIWGFQK
tara:strand:+ start:603 stop:764 length:162 start_codon:yes stop_codon:yes gene_type:complete